ncbi:peptidase S8, partial [Lysobacter sp. 2RAB21]
MRHSRRNILKLSALAIGMMASGLSFAEARLGAALQSALDSAEAAKPLEVIVSYNQPGPLRASQLQALKLLGIGQGVSMRALPIAGALATPAQIRARAPRRDVLSIQHNKPQTYNNHQAPQ